MKEPVILRKRMRKNGIEALFLDIAQNGQRKMEYLKLYLVPETTPQAKKQNAATLKTANAIKAQRTIEVMNQKAGITDNSAASKIALGDFIEAFIEKMEKHGSPTNSTKAFHKHLAKYASLQIKIGQVNRKWCAGFADYLRTKSGLAHNTQALYLARFNCVLNEAVRAEIIAVNPLAKLAPSEKINPKDANREYLTIEEVQRLIATDPGDTPSKRMYKLGFLFSCFCGLRISDVSQLKWGDLYTEADGRTFVKITMQKTQTAISLPLSPTALAFLPDRTEDTTADTLIFPRVNKHNEFRYLKEWAAAAGITKHVSFHTARHTFATMLITLGADLYTVSKLLGHSNISTTQIYAKLVDAKKTAAVDLVNGAFATTTTKQVI